MTLLADVVTASSEIAETNSRSRKIAILAELLRRLDTDEIPIAVGFLSGVPHQGRVGVGYSIAYGVRARRRPRRLSPSTTSTRRSPPSNDPSEAVRLRVAGRSLVTSSAGQPSGNPTSSGDSSPAS